MSAAQEGNIVAIPVPANTRKKRIVAPGIYLRDDGKYSYRPWVRGRRTERILKATTLRAAIKELGSAQSETPEPRIEDLIKTYLDAGCPDKRGRPRPEAFCKMERWRLQRIGQFFGKAKPSELRLKWCLDYKAWRASRIHGANDWRTGERSADYELCTLSNALNYAVLLEEIDENRIRTGRPRFRVKAHVLHCRERCPRSGDELHRLAWWLWNRCYERSRAVAWQMLFEALSGCRTEEALRMRWDAAPGKPGFVRDGKWLYIDRSKQRDGEVSDAIEITPELETLLKAMRAWRDAKFPRSPWYFPSYQFAGREPLHKQALAKALKFAGRALGEGRSCTSHGMRAFYVTWRRCLGEADAVIAEKVGHRSGGAPLIWSVYGRKLPPWANAEFNPRPKTEKALWDHWLVEQLVDSPQRKRRKFKKTRGRKMVESDTLTKSATHTEPA